MSQPQSMNKRIAVNTIYMYIRMVVVMAVSLYTSRIILDILGFTDYGIYNVIGGIVAIFSFVSVSMHTATQRYLSYALGKNDIKNFNSVLNISLILYLAIGFILFIGAETIGLWFVNEKLNIGDSSISRVISVYRLSVMTAIVLLLRIPYLSGIISQEKMSLFAINSIVEAALKLLCVSLLIVSNGDKLITYAWLILIITIIINLIYMGKCTFTDRNLYKITFYLDRTLFKKIAVFVGWRTFGAFTQMTDKQGSTILLNMFWSVTVNAALGIANQVNVAASSLLSNFQQSFMPAITKSYASRNETELYNVVCLSSKISFILISVCCLPLIVNIDYVLSVWLVDVPFHAAGFCVILMLNLVFDSFSAPLYTLILATGRIAGYQLLLSLITLGGFGLSIIFVYYGLPPEGVLVPKLFVSLLLLSYRVLLVNKIMNLNIRRYAIRVIAIPIFMFATILVGFYGLSLIFPGTQLLLFSVAFTLLIYPILIYKVVFHSDERLRIRNILLKKNENT